MNGILSGRESHLPLTSETCLLSSEANISVSVQEEIASSGDEVNGCSALANACQSSCEVDDVMSALSVAEKKTTSLETESNVFSDHSIVPFSSSSEADYLSDNSAAVTLPLSTADANNILGTGISSLHLALHDEVNNDFTVQQHSSLSQEANGLSFCSSDIAQSSLLVPEVQLNAITPAELCELRPEEVRWLYRDSAVHQKKWLPFIGYDSLRIECKFRETRARLVGNSSNHSSAADELVIVRGGLYEVDVIRKTCVPIYWTAEGVVYIFVDKLTIGFKI